MKRTVFEREMERIKTVFGEKYYPEQRLLLMWDLLSQSISDEGMEDAVNELIVSSRKYPLITEFRNTQAFALYSIIEDRDNIIELRS